MKHIDPFGYAAICVSSKLALYCFNVITLLVTVFFTNKVVIARSKLLTVELLAVNLKYLPKLKNATVTVWSWFV